MSKSFYEAIGEALAEQGDEISLPEAIGVLELFKAELIQQSIAEDDEEEYPDPEQNEEEEGDDEDGDFGDANDE